MWDVKNSGKVIYHGWELWGFGVTLLLQPTQGVIWRNQSFCSSIYQSVNWECSQSETQSLNTYNRTQQLHIVPVTPYCHCDKSLQSCLTLCDPMDHRLPSSSVYGVSQARILDWGCQGIFFRGSSWPSIEFALLTSLALTGGFFITSSTWETPSITTSTFIIIVVKFQVSSEWQ